MVYKNYLFTKDPVKDIWQDLLRSCNRVKNNISDIEAFKNEQQCITLKECCNYIIQDTSYGYAVGRTFYFYKDLDIGKDNIYTELRSPELCRYKIRDLKFEDLISVLSSLYQDKESYTLCKSKVMNEEEIRNLLIPEQSLN